MAEDRRIIVEITSNIDLDITNHNQPEKDEVPGSRQSIKVKHVRVDETARSLASYAKDKSKGLLNQVISAVPNRYFSLSENYMAETDYNNAMIIADKVRSFMTAVKTGASIGGGYGAVAAAAAWGTSEFISYQNRMSGYYQSLNATNYQTQFDKSRLGLTNEGKGTEN